MHTIPEISEVGSSEGQVGLFPPQPYLLLLVRVGPSLLGCVAHLYPAALRRLLVGAALPAINNLAVHQKLDLEPARWLLGFGVQAATPVEIERRTVLGDEDSRPILDR